MDDQNTVPSTAAPAPTCTSCGMATSGYKCAVCGEESAAHDQAHACGGENCQPKCEGCGQADSKCTCQQPQTPSSGPTPPPVDTGAAPPAM